MNVIISKIVNILFPRFLTDLSRELERPERGWVYNAVVQRSYIKNIEENAATIEIIGNAAYTEISI